MGTTAIAQFEVKATAARQGERTEGGHVPGRRRLLAERIRHAVKPFVVGVMAEALSAVAVAPERGEPGHKQSVAERKAKVSYKTVGEKKKGDPHGSASA